MKRFPFGSHRFSLKYRYFEYSIFLKLDVVQAFIIIVYIVSIVFVFVLVLLSLEECSVDLLVKSLPQFSRPH